MPEMQGYANDERRAIMRAECPKCDTKLKCPYYAEKGTCPFGERCVGNHDDERYSQGKSDAELWDASWIIRRNQGEAIPMEVDLKSHVSMNDNDWAMIRAHYDKTAEEIKATKAFKKQMKEEDEARSKEWTNIKLAQKQQAKPDATQFQALIRADAHQQNDNERCVDDVEKAKEENNTDTWKPPDLQHKNGSKCLLPSMMPTIPGSPGSGRG